MPRNLLDPFPDPSLGSRRERQVAARLEQILDTAARLFAEKGFHRTTTREIAQAADIAEGTLYNYFESKNDLLFSIMARLAETQNLTADADLSLSSDVRQVFQTMFQQRKEFVDRYATMQQAVISEVLADAELRQRFYNQILEPTEVMIEKVIQTLIQLGQIRPIDVPLTARLLTSIWIGLFFLQVMGDPLVANNGDALNELTTSVIFDGIAKSHNPQK